MTTLFGSDAESNKGLVLSGWTIAREVMHLCAKGKPLVEHVLERLVPTRPTVLGVLGGAGDFGVRAELGRVLEPRVGSPGHYWSH